MLLRGQREDGQVLPLLAMVVLTLVAGGFMLLRVGHAAIARAEATTVADAAALAAAEDLADQMRDALHRTAFNAPTALDRASATRAARTYAERNGGTLRDIAFSGLAVEVDVATHDALDGRPGDPGRGGRGTASARAEVRIDYAFAPPGPARRGPPDASEIDRIAEAAGVPVPDYSSLRNPAYQGTGHGGASINLLAGPMKASIAKLETLMGTALIVTSGYRTSAYQASLCQRVAGPCAPPGRSLHQYGLAVDVANWSQTLPYLAAAGLCQPLPANDAVHLSHASGRECGGQTGVLGGGRAFGGNPASFATITVRLVDRAVSLGPVVAPQAQQRPARAPR